MSALSSVRRVIAAHVTREGRAAVIREIIIVPFVLGGAAVCLLALAIMVET